MPHVNATPTVDLYGRLIGVTDYFNQALFEGVLPSTVITLHRRSRSSGYFSGARWRHVSGAEVSELSLNPSYFAPRPLIELFQTVVHELCHLWQHHYGKASRPGYHNAEWADKMENLGLMPSATGKPKGARTGQKMSDYPIADGNFLRACDQLIKQGFALNWVDTGEAEIVSYREALACGYDLYEGLSEQLLMPLGGLFGDLKIPEVPGLVVQKRKTKYQCPECRTNIWGKQGLTIFCGCSGQEFKPDLKNSTEAEGGEV